MVCCSRRGVVVVRRREFVVVGAGCSGRPPRAGQHFALLSAGEVPGGRDMRTRSSPKRPLTARREVGAAFRAVDVPVFGCGVDQGSDGRVAAQLVQAAAAARPDAADGMPSLALISAYGTGGSSTSRAISRWQPGGRRANASRSAAWRSAVEQLLLGRPGLIVWDGLGVRRWSAAAMLVRSAQDRRIPAGWWWRASREARPDRGSCPAGPRAAARRSGRRRRRRRRPAGACGRWTRSAGRIARRGRPTPACRRFWRGSPGQ